MSLLPKNIQQRLEEKLQSLNALRPLPPSAVIKLREQFQIEMTYNSNGIEGNSLTFKETFLVVNEGITIKGKPLKDHLEAKNHQAALEFLHERVENDKHITISERLVRQLHQLILQGVDREWAGKYRNSGVRITGADHKPPEALEVPKQMHDLVIWIGKQQHALHPVELAALAHHRIAAIHPFFDGNGRTGRLLMNILLMRAGYPLSMILKHDRKKYYRVLARADEGEKEPLVRFIAQCVERSLDMYLQALLPATTQKTKLLSLAALSRGSRYSAKYLNLLARSGALAAHKEGRVWMSSKEALKGYEEGRERKR